MNCFLRLKQSLTGQGAHALFEGSGAASQLMLQQSSQALLGLGGLEPPFSGTDAGTEQDAHVLFDGRNLGEGFSAIQLIIQQS